MQLQRGAISLKTDTATGAGIGTSAENTIYIVHVYNTTEGI